MSFSAISFSSVHVDCSVQWATCGVLCRRNICNRQQCLNLVRCYISPVLHMYPLSRDFSQEKEKSRLVVCSATLSCSVIHIQRGWDEIKKIWNIILTCLRFKLIQFQSIQIYWKLTEQSLMWVVHNHKSVFQIKETIRRLHSTWVSLYVVSY